MRRVDRAWLILVFAGSMGLIVATEIHDGYLFRGHVITSAEHPYLFWLNVSFFSLVTLVAFAYAVSVLLGSKASWVTAIEATFKSKNGAA